MHHITATFKQIGLLTTALTLALVANFAYGQWADPTAAPTGNNATAPINIGGELQNKLGDIGAFTVSASDDMRSDLYCDHDGNNCFAASTTAAMVNGGGSGGGSAWGQWQDLTGSRSSGATYQNTTGGPLMVAVTYHAFDNNNAPSYQFQVSTDGSNWIKIGQQGERWTNHSWFVPVPAGQYYRITGHNGVLSWAELAMGSAGSGSLPNCPANTTLKSDGSGGYNCATTVVCSLFHNTETCIDLSTNTCFYTNDGVWDDARRSIENHYSITTSEYQIVGGGQGAGVHSSVHEKCTTGIPNGWWQTFEVIL